MKLGYPRLAGPRPRAPLATRRVLLPPNPTSWAPPQSATSSATQQEKKKTKKFYLEVKCGAKRSILHARR